MFVAAGLTLEPRARHGHPPTQSARTQFNVASVSVCSLPISIGTETRRPTESTSLTISACVPSGEKACAVPSLNRTAGTASVPLTYAVRPRWPACPPSEKSRSLASGDRSATSPQSNHDRSVSCPLIPEWNRIPFDPEPTLSSTCPAEETSSRLTPPGAASRPRTLPSSVTAKRPDVDEVGTSSEPLNQTSLPSGDQATWLP